jgi:hypothetical protein
MLMKLIGKIRPTKNGITYDIDGGEAVLVFPLATKIQKRFGLDAGQLPAIGFDNVLVELTKNDIKIIVGWDIWSDLFVMSVDEKGNQLIRKIAEFIEGSLDELSLMQEKLIKEGDNSK